MSYYLKPCFIVAFTTAMFLTACEQASSEQPSKQDVARMEETGARVTLSPDLPKNVQRIEISKVVFGKSIEFHDGKIISHDKLNIPEQFRYRDAIELLTQFPDLEELSLWGTPVSDDDMPKIASLKKLKSINLSGTKVTDKGLSHLANMASLEELILGDTFHASPHTGDLMFRNWRNSKRVEGIQLTDQGLAPIKTLPRLRILNLRGTAISDAGLAQLKGMRTLHNINLVETKITDIGLAHLYEYLDNLERVELVDELPVMGYLVGTPRDVTKTLVTSKGVIALKDRLPWCLVVYASPQYRYFIINGEKKKVHPADLDSLFRDTQP